jgi:Ca2+-transporting ATPase
MLAGPLVGLAVPLLAAQILWINLLTHGLTGVALGAEPADPNNMKRPPRPPEQSILGEGLWQRAMRMGALIAIVTLVLGTWAHASGREWQSMMFVALTSLQLGVAVGLRARPRTLTNPFLLVAVAVSLLLVLAGVYLAPLRDLLGTQTLPISDAAIAAIAGVAGWIGMSLDLRRSAKHHWLPLTPHRESKNAAKRSDR